MTIPADLPYHVLAGAAVALITILYGLNRALADTAWPVPERTRVFGLSAVVLLGWLAVSIILATMGVYHVDESAIPTVQYAIVLPILIGSLLIWRSETVGRVIDAVPQQRLVGVQLYRALGVIFLILYSTGKLPGLFAWPAGVGDIAIGLLAPVVGYAYARAPRDTAGFVRAWNQPSSELMTVLPMVLIPIYLVPLSILLHLASLAKLHRATAPSDNRVASASA